MFETFVVDPKKELLRPYGMCKISPQPVFETRPPNCVLVDKTKWKKYFKPVTEDRK
jgi:hypothetical protein